MPQIRRKGKSIKKKTKSASKVENLENKSYVVEQVLDKR